MAQVTFGEEAGTPGTQVTYGSIGMQQPVGGIYGNFGQPVQQVQQPSGMPRWLLSLLAAGVSMQQNYSPYGALSQVSGKVDQGYKQINQALQPIANTVIQKGLAPTPKKQAPIGAEPEAATGGWTSQQIAGASQKDLRSFYALEPEERYWLARAITYDNPRLYGRSWLNNFLKQPETTSGGGGFGSVPYNVETGGGGGGGYTTRPPEWYLNMISWRI